MGGTSPCTSRALRCRGGGSAEWGRWYREARIAPLVGGLGGRRREAIDRFLGGIELPCEGPCLVHGDLWRGNAVFGREGPALIDPSVCWGERGLDLAMIRLFGGFPDAFWRAYGEVLPVPEEVERALPAYTLYFVLVHVRLFGAPYLAHLDRLVG